MPQEAQGEDQKAVSLYQRALAIREHVLGSKRPKTIETCTRYIELLRAMGCEEEATSTGIAVAE